ncbi:hypothetical protein RI054_08g43690 [Pseudoscourfieldia marina]
MLAQSSPNLEERIQAVAALKAIDEETKRADAEQASARKYLAALAQPKASPDASTTKLQPPHPQSVAADNQQQLNSSTQPTPSQHNPAVLGGHPSMSSSSTPHPSSTVGVVYIAFSERNRRRSGVIVDELRKKSGVSESADQDRFDDDQMMASRVLTFALKYCGDGILYRRGAPVWPEAFVDADHAGDTESRVSMSGVLVMAAGGAILWRSRKQALVAMSSCESELISIGDASAELQCIRRTALELGVGSPSNGTPLDGGKAGKRPLGNLANANGRRKKGGANRRPMPKGTSECHHGSITEFASCEHSCR